MVDCSKNVIKQCLEGTASGEQLSRLVDTTLGMVLAMGEAETMFCRQGGLPLTTITKAPMSQDKPCADRYYRQTPKCGDTFVEKFSVNPADETLCVEYGKVIDCAKHKIEDHCTRSEARDLRNSLYEDFNPYCEADKIIAREVAQNSTGRSSPTSLLYWFCCVILMALYGH
uniref:Uncharacterized protein LOC102800542 n=1 Tax=Saccoglossus kowalevskii TaxID=10224 RepID=A0ABM0M9K7_SACKO|nr:PREDICTED: uncharacterized protein LOC102800542 [Saccoglossus kowalevskii]